MTAKQRQDHRNNVISTLQSFGWEKDRWGNLKRTMSNGSIFRIKVQKTSLRLEKQYKDGSGKTAWLRSSSDYFKNIKIEDDGVVIGRIKVKGA